MSTHDAPPASATTRDPSADPTAQPPSLRVGIIGGSGLYRLLDPEHTRDTTIDTPYGPVALALGTFAGTALAFLARHGRHHEHAPHELNSRAHMWALKSLGVEAVVATAAVGSIDPGLAPETFVVPDQLFDATHARPRTFYDSTTVIDHLTFADPFCPELRTALCAGLRDCTETFTPNGTLGVVDGPRFSTRAESRWLRSAGVDLLNMTVCPEAALAAELNMSYAVLAFVTDLDAGETAAEAVDPALVLARMAAGTPRIEMALAATVERIPPQIRGRRLMRPSSVATVMRQAVCPAAGGASSASAAVPGRVPTGTLS